MKFKRSSGILLHISSLPTPYGIGDLGPSSYKFIDFLTAAGQSYWQVLPLNPTMEESGNSPYSSPSAFAGNTLLISPEILVQEGLLDKNDLKDTHLSDSKVEFSKVIPLKTALLEKAFHNWKKMKATSDYKRFCEDNSNWLNDYALYISIRNKNGGKSWEHWPADFQSPKENRITAANADLSVSIAKEKFCQYIFYRQWGNLKDYAYQNGIKLIGDMPFYVNYDSADCWANPEIFKLNDNLRPTAVAGVPPDYFSETGQLWGNPVFNWHTLKALDYKWWIARIRQNLKLFDVLRLDHFRAFAAYWEVAAGEKTAENGNWVEGPGSDFFNELKREWPELPFIAEDLGTIDKAVTDLLEKYRLSGMRVLQFAFGNDMPESPYLPHNHIANCLVCTGTHDNPPSRCWYENLSRKEKKNLRDYLDKKSGSKNIARELHCMALRSVANLAIIPMQDILYLGEKGTMNKPGVGKGNWEWKMKENDINDKLTADLKNLNRVFGRLPASKK